MNRYRAVVMGLAVWLSACGGSSSSTTGTSNPSTSCFYQCNLGGGGSQTGCKSDSSVVATEDACYTEARATCGASVGQSGVIACSGCDSSCAPSWWK